MRQKLDEFYNELDKLAIERNSLDDKTEKLKKSITGFEIKVKSLKINKEFEKNKDLYDQLSKTLNTLNKSSEAWVKINLSRLENELKFRDSLSDKFVVIVFGKVKAGKSSLGNFIAEHKLSKQEIKFFKYDIAGKKQDIKKLEEIDDSKGFAVNNLECTVEIQGFNLGRMVWIDTPGLGSMTKENGQLTKDYIQSADYIIYPTSSAHPFQQDEKASLEELLTQKKAVSIFITKSDTVEEDEHNGKLIKKTVNKTADRRAGQEKQVKEEIKKFIKDQGYIEPENVISLSVHTAKEALKNKDSKEFHNSNVEKFYMQFTEIVKTKANKLKAEAPLKRLQSFVENELINSKQELSTSQLKQEVEKLKKDNQASQTKFENDLKDVKNGLSLKFEAMVTQAESDTDTKIKENDKKTGKDKKELKDIYEETFKQLKRSLNEHVSDKLNESIKKTLTDVAKTMESFEETFSVDKKYNTGSIKKDKSGFIRKFFNTITFGWVDLDTEVETYKYEIGDNRDEVIKTFKTSSISFYEKQIDGQIKLFKDQFFNPFNTTVDNFLNMLTAFENEIKQIVKDK